jgi:hypothetical protein
LGAENRTLPGEDHSVNEERSGMVRGKLHLAGVLGLVAAMLASLTVLVSAAVGKSSSSSAAQYQYKVTICHRTKSKKKPFHTIRVAAAAVPAHLKHGDTLGPCATTAPAATTTSGKGKKAKPAKGSGKEKGGNQSSGADNGQPGGGNGNGKGKDK